MTSQCRQEVAQKLWERSRRDDGTSVLGAAVHPCWQPA
ncbi:hypothetical protein KCH_66450 [Kitasatospora cheerisanensis KCTC 2395]|uniref:Uncharacterized protein n=1 Tax=Kitasatospora cheerisanensis KCTC 2395 TaxID=1348663 RepID=A0A066YKC6_9ACTN|nr:hypothetical protein KCH_66450 [Kitasatospora cheerisanensis KCTC 2395]